MSFIDLFGCCRNNILQVIRKVFAMNPKMWLFGMVILLAVANVNAIFPPPCSLSLENLKTDMDPVQVAMMEERIKVLVLEATSSCKELNDFLKSSPKTLKWLSEQGATMMLNLAISLESTFGTAFMGLIFRQ